MGRADDRIDRDAVVRTIAGALKIRATTNLRKEIAARAVGDLESYLAQYGIAVETLDDLHSVILQKTGVQIVRVDSDTDVDHVAKQHGLPGLGVQLKFEFERDTEALVVRSQDRHAGGRKFVAIVDARGARQRRSWFAARHEPAHLLIPDPTAQVVFRRTTTKRPGPVEQVVDEIAAQVGFWVPILRPALTLACKTQPTLLDAFFDVRAVLAPDASLEATFRALAQLCDHPVLVIRSAWDARADGLLDSYDLRAKTVIMNTAAERTRLRVWPNYRIPQESVVRSAHGSPTTLREDDDLGRWTSETSGSLSARRVVVSAKGAWAMIEAT